MIDLVSSRRPSTAAIVLSVGVFTLTTLGAQPPSAPLVSRITLIPQSSSAGDVVLLSLTLAAPTHSIDATAFGRPVLMFEEADGRTWHGLVGIDLATKAGQYDIDVVVHQSGAAPVRLPAAVTVNPKTFPVRRLTVDPAFVNPPAQFHARIAREAERLARIMEQVTQPRLWRDGFLAPVPGAWTSSFGKRTVFNRTRTSLHAGTDFTGAVGTAVHAPSGGRVALADDLYYSGNTVIIDHGLGLYSLLAHLSRIDVREGDAVASGALVGLVGATGRVTGPHLHWAVRLHGARVDPISLMRATALPFRLSPLH